MKKKLLLHAWSVEKIGDKYYLPFTHWIYLKEIIKYYDEIVLLATCKYLNSNYDTQSFEVGPIGDISVYELPISSGSYASSIKYFFSYIKAYRSIQDVTTFYSRYPTPFGWLQKLYGKDKQRIIHYVGDPVDAAVNNPNFSFLKKVILVAGFSLENYLYNWASKGAEVYTNGHHLSENLNKKGIVATPLISSTLTEKDFYYADKDIDAETAKFIYLGYLRTAKGVETIIQAFELYNKKYPNSSLTIIGTGEFEVQLKSMVSNSKIINIRFLGQIEDRSIINQELRSADIFLFASLSEGSPRVVLEAMANGLAVISTPVGSLPVFFKNNEDIIFSNFKDANGFFEKMNDITNSKSFYNSIRLASYEKVNDVTIDNFIKKIFHE